jgi:hypothetical protein
MNKTLITKTFTLVNYIQDKKKELLELYSTVHIQGESVTGSEHAIYNSIVSHLVGPLQLRSDVPYNTRDFRSAVYDSVTRIDEWLDDYVPEVTASISFLLGREEMASSPLRSLLTNSSKNSVTAVSDGGQEAVSNLETVVNQFASVDISSDLMQSVLAVQVELERLRNILRAPVRDDINLGSMNTVRVSCLDLPSTLFTTPDVSEIIESGVLRYGQYNGAGVAEDLSNVGARQVSHSSDCRIRTVNKTDVDMGLLIVQRLKNVTSRVIYGTLVIEYVHTVHNDFNGAELQLNPLPGDEPYEYDIGAGWVAAPAAIVSGALGRHHAIEISLQPGATFYMRRAATASAVSNYAGNVRMFASTSSIVDLRYDLRSFQSDDDIVSLVTSNLDANDRIRLANNAAWGAVDAQMQLIRSWAINEAASTSSNHLSYGVLPQSAAFGVNDGSGGFIMFSDPDQLFDLSFWLLLPLRYPSCTKIRYAMTSFLQRVGMASLVVANDDAYLLKLIV